MLGHCAVIFEETKRAKKHNWYRLRNFLQEQLKLDEHVSSQSVFVGDSEILTSYQIPII